MKKIIKGVLLSLMMIVGVGSYAQDISGTSSPAINNYEQGFRLGFGVNGGIVTEKEFSASVGGDVRLQYDLTQRGSIIVTTGYTHLFGEDEVRDLGYIPAKAGFKYFVWEDNFYILGEAGAGFPVTRGYDKTSFLWSPGIGYANKVIDLSVRYEGANDFNANQVALRLAYGFKL